MHANAKCPNPSPQMPKLPLRGPARQSAAAKFQRAKKTSHAQEERGLKTEQVLRDPGMHLIKPRIAEIETFLEDPQHTPEQQEEVLESFEASLSGSDKDGEGHYFLALQAGVRMDWSKHMVLMRKAAEQGHAEAQFQSGMMKWQGMHGVSPDKPQAFHLLQLAVDQDHIEARRAAKVQIQPNLSVQGSKPELVLPELVLPHPATCTVGITRIDEQ